MKKRYFLLLLILITGLIINSCKKTGLNPIPALFTGGHWQLASIEVQKYIGNQGTSDTTVNDSCGQRFVFNKDNTCTYTNFNCFSQPTSTGTWKLTPNQLYLNADMACDSSATKTSKPFINAQIQNLGQYSLVLRTGDITPNYSLTQPRTIVIYGFIRQKDTGSN